MKISIIGGLDAHAWRLIKTLLASRHGDPPFDAIEGRRWLRETFEIDIDWHPVASILDELRCEGKAEFTGSKDGYWSYRIL